ncbi:TadE/TadG family type IV pilus assembly protein [Thalassotalea mangrovi]|uniref:Putative Flp pilus-assembly TadG-like N-terminal domain-containing protein n=1 Tax=Thalassotalea mangrovi TaxID=2572245 RepID=A0A4U1B3F1_9GAMM|nr:TadE/TadG family type IV pilus assembly protein [Thalassotalea mangrovi]TKB44228.1 hypothetical protein E8M12_12500 [Thalassotalea mangrovi]
MSNYLKPLRKQQGNIIVVFTISLLSLIGLSALALDGGHMLLSKTRLQNIVDSAALHAAKEIDLGASHDEARLAALAIINQNLQATENADLQASFTYTSADEFSISVTPHLEIDFSERPDPFISSTLGSATYVKVVMHDLALSSYLANVFGFDKEVSASALAGPSTEIVDCYNDLAPIMACGTPPPPGGSQDDHLFGYDYNQIQLMKTGSNSDPEVGPGNFQIVRLPGDAGGNDAMRSLAGAAFQNDICFSPSTAGLETEPGNTVGPIYNGLNTRFGIDTPQLPADEYPRDVNTCHGDLIELDSNNALPEIVQVTAMGPVNPSERFTTKMAGETLSQGYYAYDEDTDSYQTQDFYDYEDYDATAECPASAADSGQGQDVFVNNIVEASETASVDRRILNIPIAHCTGDENGQTTINYLGTGCFYIMQPITSHGGQDSFIVGQFIENCTSEGAASWQATDNNGPYTIVLYHVPDSSDS